jgi:hypothetical protein
VVRAQLSYEVYGPLEFELSRPCCKNAPRLVKAINAVDRRMKTFDAEGEALELALTKSLHLRNEAIKSLRSSVRRFRDATIKEECRSDCPHALQALWKALDRAEDLIQN